MIDYEGIEIRCNDERLFKKLTNHSKVKKAYELKICGGVPIGEMVTLYSGKRGGKSLLQQSKPTIIIDGFTKSAAWWMDESQLIFDETDYLGSIEIYNKFKKNLTRIEDGRIITTSVAVKPSKLLNNLIGRIYED